MKSQDSEILPERLSPQWLTENMPKFEKQVKASNLNLDCSQLQHLDSLALGCISSLHKTAQSHGHQLKLQGLKRDLQPELAKVVSEKENKTIVNPSLFEVAGEGLVKLWSELRSVLFLLSESIYWSTWGLRKRKTILKGETVKQMILLGSNALPIVALLSFLVGLTLAIQSGLQLSRFGASIYLASGIGISMVTEIGPLMTAIILAGRSGASITAEISTMVVQEELGALHTMAINPLHFLVLPRFWAMSITLPLLTICAAVAGIVAGWAVGVLMFDLSTTIFFKTLIEAVTVDLIYKSIFKSLIFAWIISLIAISKGLQVRGGADAVGRATTSCVVSCIFIIILADAGFSFLFYT